MSNEYPKVIYLSESDEMRELIKMNYYDAPPEIVYESKRVNDQKAQFAMELLRTNGVLLGKYDERSAQEVVDRALVIAELAFEAFAERGWMHPVTPYEDVLAVVAKLHTPEYLE